MDWKQSLFPGPPIIPDRPPVEIAELIPAIYFKHQIMESPGDAYWRVKMTGEILPRWTLPESEFRWERIHARCWPGNRFMAVRW